MVAQEILDLLVWVRALVPEPFFYLWEDGYGETERNLAYHGTLWGSAGAAFEQALTCASLQLIICNFKALRTHVLGVFLHCYHT